MANREAINETVPYEISGEMIRFTYQQTRVFKFTENPEYDHILTVFPTMSKSGAMELGVARFFNCTNAMIYFAGQNFPGSDLGVDDVEILSKIMKEDNGWNAQVVEMKEVPDVVKRAHLRSMINLIRQENKGNLVTPDEQEKIFDEEMAGFDLGLEELLSSVQAGVRQESTHRYDRSLDLYNDFFASNSMR